MICSQELQIANQQLPAKNSENNLDCLNFVIFDLNFVFERHVNQILL